MDIIFCVFGTLCAIVISIFIWMVYYDYIMRQKMKSLPKLKAYPLIGHSIELIRMTEAGKKRYNKYMFTIRVRRYLYRLIRIKESLLLTLLIFHRTTSMVSAACKLLPRRIIRTFYWIQAVRSHLQARVF